MFRKMFFPGLLNRKIITAAIPSITRCAVPPIGITAGTAKANAVLTNKSIHPMVAMEYLKPNCIA